MLEKIKNYWTSLDQEITVNKREMVMGLALCTFAGIVIGTMLSPNIHVTIGSNNILPSPEDEDAE